MQICAVFDLLGGRDNEAGGSHGEPDFNFDCGTVSGIGFPSEDRPMALPQPNKMLTEFFDGRTELVFDLLSGGYSADFKDESGILWNGPNR